MLNPTELIAAIRNDRRVGRGTCSTIDECYDDAEIVTAFGDEPTIKAAVKAAHRLEGLRMDAMPRRSLRRRLGRRAQDSRRVEGVGTPRAQR